MFSGILILQYGSEMKNYYLDSAQVPCVIDYVSKPSPCNEVNCATAEYPGFYYSCLDCNRDMRVFVNYTYSYKYRSRFDYICQTVMCGDYAVGDQMKCLIDVNHPTTVKMIKANFDNLEYTYFNVIASALLLTALGTFFCFYRRSGYELNQIHYLTMNDVGALDFDV